MNRLDPTPRPGALLTVYYRYSGGEMRGYLAKVTRVTPSGQIVIGVDRYTANGVIIGSNVPQWRLRWPTPEDLEAQRRMQIATALSQVDWHKVDIAVLESVAKLVKVELPK